MKDKSIKKNIKGNIIAKDYIVLLFTKDRIKKEISVKKITGQEQEDYVFAQYEFDSILDNPVVFRSFIGLFPNDVLIDFVISSDFSIKEEKNIGLLLKDQVYIDDELGLSMSKLIDKEVFGETDDAKKKLELTIKKLKSGNIKTFGDIRKLELPKDVYDVLLHSFLVSATVRQDINSAVDNGICSL